MSRMLPRLVAIGLLGAASPCASRDFPGTGDLPRAGTVAYRWSISASATDPHVNVASAAPGPLQAYLWLESCDLPGPVPDGLAAAEFDLVSTSPANGILGFTPAAGWLNSGGASILRLVPSGCPCGPVLAGSIWIVLQESGSLGIGASSNGPPAGVDCRPAPSTWDMEWTGLLLATPDAGACCLPDGSCAAGLYPAACAAAGGLFQGIGTTCAAAACEPVSLEPDSWGRVKGSYR